jgi:cytidine deaminase
MDKTYNMEPLVITAVINRYQYDELAEADRELIDKAKEATKRSYAPYSKFYVGAAAKLKNGITVCGNNQENAAYPSGLCAERTTLFYANSLYPDQAVTTLAIAAQTEGDFIDMPIPPCGACRQVILETERRFGEKIRLLLYGRKVIYEVNGIDALMPLSFDSSNLEG